MSYSGSVGCGPIGHEVDAGHHEGYCMSSYNMCLPQAGLLGDVTSFYEAFLSICRNFSLSLSVRAQRSPTL